MDYQQYVNAVLSRRRFLQYSGMAAGGSLLAACAGTGGGGGAASSGGSNLPTLNQWYHQYGEAGTQQAVYRYAKQYTKANVKVSWLPGTGDEYPNKVRTALLGSGAPDVFELPQPRVDQVKAGQLEPLDDLIADVKSEFSATTQLPLTINGKVYGIKMINDTQMLYYRKSLLEKAGVQPPTTMDDLIKAAKTLTSGNVKGLYVGQDGGVNALRYIAPWAAGADFLVDDKIVFDTDATAEAFAKILELNKSGGLLQDAPTFWWDPSSFTQGLCAMQWTGLWAMPGITKALGDDFGVVPFPSLTASGKPATVLGGWAEMVYAKGSNVDAAKAYVKYLWVDSADIQKDWCVAYGFHVPPRSSTAASTDKLQTGPAKQTVDALNQYGHSLPATWDTAMETILTGAFSNILKNGANPKSEVHSAAQKCQTELTQLLG